jgi:hypothetical protein
MALGRLVFAQSFRRPLVMHGRWRFVGVVKDEHKGAPHFSSRRSQMHGRSARDYDWRASSPTDVLAARGFEARFASGRVPSFRARMRVRRSRHAGSEYRFHVLRRVSARCNGQRSDCRHVLSATSMPRRIFDGEQPRFSERIYDAASFRFRRFGSFARWEDIEMPKRLRTNQFTD